MAHRNPRLQRRNVIKLAGAGGLFALAGCIGDDDDPDDEQADDDDDDAAADDDDDGDDDQDLPSTESAPEGQPLSDEEIEALIEVFDDDPTNADQREVEGEIRSYTPEHVWKWVSDGTLIALHFNDPNPEEADELLWVSVATKGLFTAESRPDEEFTHFHRHTADSWEGGHGGEEGDEGYWLTHIAVQDFEAPAWEVETGVDYDFMPTPPEDDTTGHETDWTSPEGGEGDLAAEERDALIEVFDDEWTNEDQMEADGFTPSHNAKWVNEDVFVFLHWDDPVPTQAENLIYFGIGVRGQFDEESIPAGQADDFTHFHKWEAESWEAGHGAQESEQHGFWLVHTALRPLEMPWGEVEVGVDREFMPTPVE